MPSKLLARAGNSVPATQNDSSVNRTFQKPDSPNPEKDEADGGRVYLTTEPLKDIADAVCVHPRCPLDDFHIAVLDATLSSILKDRPRFLMLDFSMVDNLDSAGLGYLVALQKRLRAENGELFLYALRPKLQRFIDMLGFGSFFSVALDLPYAIEYIEKAVKEVFPILIQCPACSASMSIAQPGRGRCRACQAILTVLPDGSVVLG